MAQLVGGGGCVSPACAGVEAGWFLPSEDHPSQPRARGGRGPQSRPNSINCWSAPRTRGWRVLGGEFSLTGGVSPALAGVEGSLSPRRSRRSGGRSQSWCSFPRGRTLTRRVGIENATSIFNPRYFSHPVPTVTVRRPGEPQCVSPAQAGVYIDMRLTLPGPGRLGQTPTARGSGATGRGLGLLRGGRGFVQYAQPSVSRSPPPWSGPAGGGAG